MAEIYPAHIYKKNEVEITQSVREHSVNVAVYAQDKLGCVKLKNTAYLTGLLHDMGKCTEIFRDYIVKASDGKDVVRGSVNHTFCGAVYLLERYHTNEKPGMRTLTCEVISYAIAAHHGMFDLVTLDGNSGYEHRLQKDRAELCYDEAVRGFLEQCAEETEIDELFNKAVEEISGLFTRTMTAYHGKKSFVMHIMGLVARMLLSALIDADRRDTAEFMTQKKFEIVTADKQLWRRQLVYFEDKMSCFDNTSPINKARREFSDKCRAFASRDSGIYLMTLPTGAGKTLTALRYALSHAAEKSKKRIIFVIPLLSILEQNSDVIRDSIADKRLITEHHSNVIYEPPKSEQEREECDYYELMTQTWEAPVIITTLVQLLNTLFSGKSSCVRRMSALADSVIIIDEIQSLPKKVTDMFCMAMNYFTEECGATVVLSSATQPQFGSIERKLHLSESCDMVPFDERLFGVFKRSTVIDCTTSYGMSIDELAEFSFDKFTDINSLLLICNTRASALKLYRALDVRGKDYELYHLSASMCMAHRRATLDAINACLRAKRRIICISTQIVEAGVDFSFEGVIRVLAGVDNIAQAAGRCNRSNDFGHLCNVYIVNLKQSDESLKLLPDISASQRSTTALLSDYRKSPESYGEDLLSEKSIAAFYNKLFADSEISRQFSYPVKTEYSQNEHLYDLLGENALHTQRKNYSGNYLMSQSFKTAGELFEVFDAHTYDVIVPYNEEARRIIAELQSEKSLHDFEHVTNLIEAAKPFVIHLYVYQKLKLDDEGMVYTVGNGRFLALQQRCYNEAVGFINEELLF